MNTITSFPLICAAGTPRELGRQHGEQAAEKITCHLDFLCESLALSRTALAARALSFEPLFARHCPQLLDELAGLAEGAGIAYGDALAVNIRAALGVGHEAIVSGGDSGCTAFAVAGDATSRGELLIGQNSDTLPVVQELAYVLQLKPAGKPQMLMWTFGGMLGYHGLNEYGVAHFANDLGGGPVARFALPHYPLKRLLLECRTLEEVLALFRSVPLWASGNYVLCDGSGRILDVEVTPEDQCELPPTGPGLIVHSNHFLGPKHATEANYRHSTPDSFARLDRLQELLQSRLGDLSVANLQQFLRDRKGQPNAICRSLTAGAEGASWMTAGITVASIVAEPLRGRMHIAPGNGQDAEFTRYEI